MMQKPIPRKVKEYISQEQIVRDLKHYQEVASTVDGITGAAIIGRDDICVDPRVSYKCSIPKCFGYGTCAHCPPHTISAEETQKLVQYFNHAIFIKMDLPPYIVAGEELAKAIRLGDSGQEAAIPTGRAVLTISKAVAKVESAAFYDGYYFAMGFGAASCKVTLCAKFDNCSVLERKRCRQPYFARPSMEGAGFDALRMAARVGWDVYPIGSSCHPEDIPHGTLLGLVLIT
jgi:predicted metal-binding protein